MIDLMGHRHHGHHHHHLLHLPSFGRAKEGSAAAAAAAAAPPKGCMAIRVGQEGEEQQRFVVPVVYLTHPLFLGLLKEAEEVYGFDHKGAISIPCHVEYFRQVQGMIEKGRAGGGGGGGAHHDHQEHHHHHHFHLTSCFGGLKA